MHFSFAKLKASQVKFGCHGLPHTFSVWRRILNVLTAFCSASFSLVTSE